MVGSQSLSNKLLDYGDTGNAGATVGKRDTTPLKSGHRAAPASLLPRPACAERAG